MNIYDGFGFTGQQFQLVYQDTIAFLQGNALCLWNLDTNKKEYIQSSKNGFQCFSTNYKKRLIAVAEYGLNPPVYIYNYPQREVVMTLHGVSQLQILMMDISFDGHYLLAVTEVPKYEICVWDLLTGQRVQGANSSLPLKFNFVRGGFCSTSSNRFYLMYQKSLQLYEMVPSFEKGDEENNLVKNIKMELVGQCELMGGDAFIVWDFLTTADTGDGTEQTNIYLVEGGSISYISGVDLKIIATFEYGQDIKHLIVTQKYIIVVNEQGLINWLYKFINVNIDDQTRLPFKLAQQYTVIADENQEKNITCILYNHYYTRLIVGLADASIIVLPIAAESSVEEDEEPDQGKDRNDEEVEEGAVKIHEVEATKLGPYQRGAVTMLKEFKTVNVVVSGCDSGNIAFWDILKRDVLTSFTVYGKVTCGELALNDQLLIVGSDQGVIRIINIANIRKPVILRILKLYKNKTISTIALNPNGTMIAICSVDSPKVFFYAVQSMTLIGYVELPVACSGIAWNSSQKQVVSSVQAPMLFAITHFLLAGIQPPDPQQSYPNLKLETDVCQVYGRKIDPDQTLIAVNPLGGEVLTAGKDKVFKKYKQPEELLSKMDLKVKIASQQPQDEQDGHPMPPTCFSCKVSTLYSGASDGSIMARSSDRIGNDVKIFKGHSLRKGGVSVIEASSKHKMIFTGDYEGGIFWWTNEKIKQQESDADKVMKNVFDIPEGVDDHEDQDVKHYQQVLEEEYMESQAPIREQQKREKKQLLQQIKDKLYRLIDQNDNADDLEKLDRDEFVIDIASRDQILENGARQRQQLREQVKREIFRQEILHKLIKEKTWDNMEIPLKGCNGLNTNLLVYNYHIRIRTAEEIRKLSLVKQFRRQELKERQIRKEKKQAEVWILEDHLSDPKNYIVNALPGAQTMVLTDYEKKEEPIQQQGAKGLPGAKGPGGPAAKPGQRGAPAKGGPVKQEQVKEEVQEEKKEEKQAPKQEEKKEGADEFSDWEYLYGVFDLFTNNRKRNQMILINNVIFSIKRSFNVEFEKAMQMRQSELDNINERNKRIAEILGELKKPIELFQPKKNLLENPENVLQVENDEIPFAKYLTKEEREKKEFERKKEEERLKALMADDSGVRAIKDMMGGTLDEKKETPLDEKLEVEDWMNKPQEEMTEDERVKMKEFEVKKQRLEEEKEKIRKNLESELKKLRNEILEICFRFDEKLLILFRRKLEYDYRIYEQELYVIRLALSIIMQSEATVKIKDLKNLMEELTMKEKKAQQMRDELENLKNAVEGQKQKVVEQINNAFGKSGPGMNFDVGKIKNVWVYAFEELKKDDKKRKEQDKKMLSDPTLKDQLIHVDPFMEFEIREVQKSRDQIFENYLKDIQEKVTNMQLFDYNEHGPREFTLRILQERFSYKKDFERLDSDLTDLKNFSSFQEQDLSQIETNLTTSRTDHEDITTMLEKSKSNIELLVRFKQGLVEISQDKPVPNLSEATLIPKEAIEAKNNEIKKQGKKKIDLMEEIKKIKFDVAKSEYELKRRDLIIKDLECKTREVQLLKVKKEMQVALTKKDTRLNEQELKNLQDQIDMLRQATEKRIMIYQKKEEKIKKDIEFIMKENEQLLAQGANLNVSVKQLQEISDMTFKKNAKQSQGADDVADNQAFDKFKQISVNRKYFDLAKKQTEEIELLREELNKLKARTFANFSNGNR